MNLLQFPVTLGLIATNVIIYGINLLRLFGAPYISIPGRIDAHAFLAHFSHLDSWHIFMNMFVLWQVGPILESRLSSTKYLSVVVIIWVLLTIAGAYVSTNPSLGFSGIGLGLMTFLAFLFWGKSDISQSLFMWIGINILIGFHPQISFVMHFVGALAGAGTFGIMHLLRIL